MEQLKRKMIVSVILSVCFTIYSHAFTPPSNVLDKQVSYIERNGLEYTLRDEVSLTVDEFVKFGLNKEATLEWEDGGNGNYILVITINDILTKYTNITKILFIDRKNKDHVLMNRIIYNQEEISGYNKLTLIKQWTTGAVLEKRKANTGTYEEKRDMSQVTKFWQGGIDKGLTVNYNTEDIVILDANVNSEVRNVLIKADNESCKITFHIEGDMLFTNCLELTNSKKIKIFCTKNKKICKTVDEIHEYMYK